MNTRASAMTPTTAAATARILSAKLKVGDEGSGRGADAGREEIPEAATAGRPAAETDAAGGALVEADAATGAAGAGVAAATAAGDGILMVGAAVGFGGRLMRTVSFFGCTLADSEGFGGTAPGGT